MDDLTGRRFGRWTVIGFAGYRNGKHHTAWRCRCECGNERVVRAVTLKDGRSGSCGCLRTEKNRRHGDAGSNPEYRVWQSMLGRCRNPRSMAYRAYGGRGITVCDAWADYRAFLRDMGRRPSPEHSSLRIDVNGNYSPENVRWATRVEQARNKRSTAMVTARGRTRCVADWARDLGVRGDTIRGRLLRGWAEEDAVSRPPVRRNRHTRGGIASRAPAGAFFAWDYMG